MRMPLACSITGMVLCLACSRANAESCRTSRRDRPRRIWARVARARAVVSCAMRLSARDSLIVACKRAALSRVEPGGSEGT